MPGEESTFSIGRKRPVVV